jgi:hypothetical protein
MVAASKENFLKSSTLQCMSDRSLQAKLKGLPYRSQ